MNFKRNFWWVVIFLCASSCIKDIDIAYPDYEEQIVLTGLMQPDSILKVRVAKTLPVLSADNNYPVISNASVVCFENNVKIGNLLYTKDGFYVLNYRPKAGLSYRFEVLYEDKRIVAEDTIPNVTDIMIKLGSINSQNPNQNPDLFLSLSRRQASYVWLSAITSYKYGTKLETSGAIIASSHPLFDTFNTRKSLEGINGYEKYARLKPDFLGNINFKFTVANQVSVVKAKGDSFFFQISDVSQNYDRYLKSSLTAFKSSPSKNGGINDPFSEPIAIYSNVKNGIGIVGAIQTRRIILKEGK
ncbi:MAG: DUF4249 domain-containing protein [Cytophagia bacterium]|nr:MAG: DUF4249 domain-containing protein [Runella sp.]TAG19348.1 MAG: DUF4249 domain-containing protein [Cytophagales bacterium]TAG38612.1 MAG: DUF4249 domain-containing protein [Cytophagia bacterium]TAG51665.1 MAG: DUF4249 domain-containing protein [Runella slithyformis]TAG80262.1 MAG: DUF4249 domain-containing protein [Cytophagales bacterium]